MAFVRVLKHVALVISLLTIAQMLTPFAGRLLTRLVRTAPFSRRTMSTFKLDNDIFNATLYKQLTDVWLPGVDLKGEQLDQSILKRWFVPTPDERDAFDKVCREQFAHALDAIGPDVLPEPTAQPFIDEITRIAKDDPSDNGSKAAWTALSLALLLDQIPRNLYRTNESLRKVYNHYDVMSYSLARALLHSPSIVPRVDLHPQWRLSAAHRIWFYMPLVHSEDVEAHKYLDSILGEFKEELGKLEGFKGSKGLIEGILKSEKDHRDIIDRFGRYPHRNEALGRESTEEEKKFLADGGATFGVGQKKSET